MPCVLDTNLLIYFLNGGTEAPVTDRIAAAMEAGAHYSVITRMEVLGWRGHTDDSRRLAQTLLDQLIEIPLTPAIVERVVALRSGMAIKLPDAIIAASALEAGVPLMTRNANDFRRIEGLRLENPFESD